MLYQIYTITIKELKILFRDRAVLSVLFFLPVVFVFIMTFAGVGNQSVRAAKILVINEDKGTVANRVVERLRHENGLTIQDLIHGQTITESSGEKFLLQRGSDIALILVFPSTFSEKLLASPQNKHDTALVKFIADPATGGQNLNPIERLIKIQIMSVASALAAAQEGQRVIKLISEKSSNKNSSIMHVIPSQFAKNMDNIDTKIQDRVAFQRVAPQGWANTHPIKPEEQNVPGYTIFGVFFIVQVIGTTLLREKENGTFNRLMAAPISRSVLLIGKLIPFYIVNIIQVIFMFTFGYFVFHISLGHSLLGLFAITLATAAAANALGLLIAAISKTTEQMGPMSGVILVCMATLGGIFIPYFEMPNLLQKLSFLTPHAWALKGFQDILVRGYNVLSVLPSVSALLLFALVFYTLALLRFRFE